MVFRQHVARTATVVAAAAAVTLGTASVAVAGPPSGPDHAVFVQTNALGGNAVIAFDRHRDGRLSEEQTYPTGGLGGTLPGAVVDPLASQGSLTYDVRRRALYAVNAGSDTVTAFDVRGDDLSDRQIVPSGGHLPVSVSAVGDLIYVLNAGGDGAISGLRRDNGHVVPLSGSTRSLGLGNPATPPFLDSPGQVAITPDRRHVVVATKSHGTLVVFNLDAKGRPAGAPVVTTAPAGSVPFALSFDARGRLLVAGAAGGASSYAIRSDGSLSAISAFVPNGQKATCWSTVAQGRLYTANAGSNTISGYSEAADGQLALLDADGVTAVTDAGPVDLAASSDGANVYQLATGAGVVDAFRVAATGGLVRIGTVAGLPPDAGDGIEGIAAT